MTESRRKELDELMMDMAFRVQEYQKLSLSEAYYIMEKAEEHMKSLPEEDRERKIFEEKRKYFSAIVGSYIAKYKKMSMSEIYQLMKKDQKYIKELSEQDPERKVLGEVQKVYAAEMARHIASYKKMSMAQVYQLMKKEQDDMQELAPEDPKRTDLLEVQKIYSAEIASHIQNMENFYVAFFSKTNMPYVYCNEETYDDEVMLFTEEQQLLDKIESLGKEKIELRAMKITKEQGLLFFLSLFYLGVNAVVFNPDTDDVELQLTQIVKSPKWNENENKAAEVVNSELQLTMMYFMQLYHKPIELQEKLELPELEEEMLKNLVKGKYLIPLVKNKQTEEFRIPFITHKNKDSFFQAFTDRHEFQKYLSRQVKDENIEIKAAIWDFKQIQDTLEKEIKNVKGIEINPYGCNLIILKDKLPLIAERFL